MNNERKIRIIGVSQKRFACQTIGDLPTGGDYEVVIREHQDKRTLDQNAKIHPLIEDINQQAFPDYKFQSVKAVLVKNFAQEKDDMGEPLRHPGEMTWDWMRKEWVYVRPSTTKFTKRECGEFIEWLYAEGHGLDVQFSEKALSIYDDYGVAA